MTHHLTPIDHFASGALVPLAVLVRRLRRAAEDADWAGDTATAGHLEREADDAIRAGRDPVPMF